MKKKERNKTKIMFNRKSINKHSARQRGGRRSMQDRKIEGKAVKYLQLETLKPKMKMLKHKQ